eukprot:7705887-Alexandrium_andersonii.AAC.1
MSGGGGSPPGEAASIPLRAKAVFGTRIRTTPEACCPIVLTCCNEHSDGLRPSLAGFNRRLSAS